MHEIKALTSLRGIAALAVVLQHFSATAQTHAAVWIPSLAPHGYMAVDFFFILSGFIMAYTYLAAFQANGWAAFPDFLAKRIARVVPLQIAVLALLMVAAATSVWLVGRNLFFVSDALAFDLVANMLLLHGLGIGTNLNGPSWSISTEFAAYLGFPLFVAAVFHRRAIIAGVALGVAIASLCWIAWQRPRLGLDTTAIDVSLIRCFTEFVIGLGAFRLFRSERVSAWLGRDDVVCALTALAGALLLVGIDLPVALLFPFLIVGFARNEGWPARLLEMRVPYFLGVISYSIYLIHSPVRPVALNLVRSWHPAPLGFFPALGFALAGSLAIIPFAWLTYVLFERPGRVLVRRLLTGRGTTRSQPA